MEGAGPLSGQMQDQCLALPELHAEHTAHHLHLQDLASRPASKPPLQGQNLP